MRILLTSNASYEPPRGGSTRSNLAWLRYLATRGHECRVVCPRLDGPDDTITRDGIAVVRVHNFARRTERLREEIAAMRPDRVLVSSEDLSHMLLREAQAVAPGRLVYLAHTPQFFPFGPESWNPDAEAARILRSASTVVAIGQHMAGYIERHLGIRATVVHPPVYGRGPWQRFGDPGRGSILMINPCAVKGIDIFDALALRFPELSFSALAGWGTTAADRERLQRLGNVRILEAVGDIDEVLSDARILLMPSLWYEGFGLIAMEAMLRGLPVIASDSGGLLEAKTGTGYILPVRPIERYEGGFDENHMPRPVIPAQDVEPWTAALNELITDPEAYRAESERSRSAAESFVSRLDAADFERMLEGSNSRLRILLAHNSLYYPSHGGGDVSNRLLMEALAARGHCVQVVSRVERFGLEAEGAVIEQLNQRGIHEVSSHAGVVSFELHGVHVHTVASNPHLRNYFSERIEDFHPDVIITSTDDPAQILFDAAIRSPRARVVHLVRATIAVPFGPDSSSPSVQRTEALRKAGAVVGVSEYVARYVREHGRIDAVHVPISLMPPGEVPALGSFESPYVTLVNPCAVKGISIFLELARRMPQVRFAAVPTWGTNAEDLRALRSLPNIDVLEPVDDIDKLLRITKVLLVPSLWAEARSRIVVEAMARGVPVIASDVGGIPEAKLGVPYLIPVQPIARYLPAVDENMVPVAEVPPQEIEPWCAALETLLGDRAQFEQIANRSRKAALDYIRGLSVERFEQLLRGVAGASGQPAPAQPLTADRQRLLALRLRQRAGNPWFPGVEKAGDNLRLFCFPHAGAGALHTRDWVLPGVTVIPVLPPGRESRLDEPPLETMEEMVSAIVAAIAPYLGRKFAFFGHSMGAAVAFEVARRLRVKPALLVVSAAKAPQFRLGWTPPPEPDRAALIADLRAHGGLPEDPKLLSVMMPAAEADARLYRNYVYQPGAALATPICAYGGSDDPNVRTRHLEAWAAQTTGAFTLRLFRGAHMYIQDARKEFLAALAADLEPPDRRGQST